MGRIAEFLIIMFEGLRGTLRCSNVLRSTEIKNGDMKEGQSVVNGINTTNIIHYLSQMYLLHF